MSAREITLDYLRSEAKLCFEGSAFFAKEAAEKADPDAWDQSRIMLGQALALEALIQYVRGLTTREFYLEKKKGTL